MKSVIQRPSVKIAILLLLVLGASDVFAEDSERLSFFRRSHEAADRMSSGRIETERHDFTQSTETVGRGVVQIESGYSFFLKSDEGETEQSHTAPESMLRLGLAEDVEFRLRYNAAWLFGETENRQGSEDLRFSFKGRLNDQLGWLPEGAVELRFSTPSGGRDWSTSKVESGIDYIYGWQLREGIELYGSTGVMQNALGDFAFRPTDPASEEFVVYTQSLAVGIETTEDSTLYVEFFGLFTDGFEDEEESPVFFNLGFDYFLSDDFVIDFRAGNGLNDDADDFFCGIGGGVRF